MRKNYTNILESPNNGLLKLSGIWKIFDSGTNYYDEYIKVHMDFFTLLSTSYLPKTVVRTIKYDLNNGSDTVGIAIGIDTHYFDPGWKQVNTITFFPEVIQVSSENSIIQTLPIHDTEYHNSDNILLQGTLQEKEIKLFLTSISWFFQNNSSADDVIITNYDPRWAIDARTFMDSFIKEFGKDIVRRIEHFGSTSIPGMPSKPILDFLVEVSSLSETMERVVSFTADKNWEFWWYENHIALIKRNEETRVRTHHVHIATHDNKIWNGLHFRDRLKINHSYSQEYAALKTELALQYPKDREKYTQAKGEFIRKIMKLNNSEIN